MYILRTQCDILREHPQIMFKFYWWWQYFQSQKVQLKTVESIGDGNKNKFLKLYQKTLLFSSLFSTEIKNIN